MEDVNTNRCSPVEMRKNLVIVDAFLKAGIDFVPIPVLNNEDKCSLVNIMIDKLDKLERSSLLKGY